MASLSSRIEAIEDLPVLPDTFIRLASAFGSEAEVDFGDLLKIVETDEAMSLQIVKLANSSLYGGGDEILGLSDSLKRLGFSGLRRLVLAQQSSDLFDRPVESYGLIRGQLWKGSISGALAAQECAKLSGFQEEDLCFTAGLIRDIGKIAIGQIFDQATLERLWEPFSDADEGQIEREMRILSCNHAEVGAELAMRMGLPDRLIKAIRYHHEPPIDLNLMDPLFDMVHVGDVVSMHMGMGIGLDGLDYHVSDAVTDRLDLSMAKIEQIMVEVQAWMDELVAVENK